MVTSIIRCVIIYFIALLVMRIMGKRQIAQMQPFELVITLIIADLATVPMSDTNIPLLNGIVPLLTLTILHFIISLFCCANARFRRFVNGHPMIVIDSNGINEENLKKMYMNTFDLVEACRNAGYFNLEEIEYAIVETNGSISIMPKSDATPTVKKDLNIKEENPTLATILILDGVFSDNNLDYVNLTKEQVLKFLKQQNIESIKNITILSTYGDSVYLKELGKKFVYLEDTTIK